MNWKRVDADRYYEMLGVLPPAHMTGKGFLVGEAMSHRKCRLAAKIEPTYTALIEHKGRYYESLEPLTIAEFDVLDVRQLCEVQT